MAVLTNLLFVLTFGLTVTTEVDLQKRIIGGGNCLDHERPYHVRFEYPGGGPLLCGGSLISDRWILTAAHCWVNGMVARLSPHPGPGQVVPFGQHPVFDNVDLMLVELQQPTGIRPIPLPNCANRLLPGRDVVRIAGYGSDQVGPGNTRVGGEAPVLQCADFTVVGAGRVRGREDNRTSQCFLVDTTHVATSPGDSGGGVVFNGAIYGVHRGSANGTHAHAGRASFVDVCHYMDWITDITGITP